MRECFFAFLVFLFLTGCNSDPNGLSKDFKIKGRSAFEALERLDEHSKSGIPRDLHVEAEKEIAEAVHAEASNADHRASVTLQYYLTRVERRDLQADALALSQEHETFLRTRHRLTSEAEESRQRMETQLEHEKIETQSCHDELSRYFGSLSYVRNNVEFGHCAAEFEKDANAPIE